MVSPSGIVVSLVQSFGLQKMSGGVGLGGEDWSFVGGDGLFVVPTKAFHFHFIPFKKIIFQNMIVEKLFLILL